jgi:hypothetical protein
VLEGVLPWWEPCSSGASFGHWKRGEVETYGECVCLGQSHEQGPHVGVGLRPAYTCGLEAVASCALKGSGSGRRRLRIWRWDCGVVTCGGNPWSGVASYMGSNWGVGATSNAGSLWEWQPHVPWRKPSFGESLALEGAKQWSQPAVCTGEER